MVRRTIPGLLADAAVLGCAVVLLGAFLVTLLGRRPDDDGVDWRSLLEGAPPVRP